MAIAFDQTAGILLQKFEAAIAAGDLTQEPTS
jgi:hypothetical protein